MTDHRQSANHHWWPVTIQRHWVDQNGDVSWIEPCGLVRKKRAHNRQIGFKRHGHTILLGSVWQEKFEREFDIDNEAHRIISALNGLKPLGLEPADLIVVLKLMFKRNMTLRDACKYYLLDAKLHRNLLLLILSLLVRSPAKRATFESYPSTFGLPPDETVGKLNIAQNFRIAKELCNDGPLSNQFFILLHSPSHKFIHGDGNLDWLSNSLPANRINGRALIPLTPRLCIYFCTPAVMRSNRNCASLTAAHWLVDWANEITQACSKDKLFFLGKSPSLSEAFRRRQFLKHTQRPDEIMTMLDDIASGGLNAEDWRLNEKTIRPQTF